MPRFIILASQRRASLFGLFKPAIVGRSEECDLVLPNVSVSRQHARIDLDPARFWYPEDQKVTFGRKGMVPIDGLLAKGVVAEVAWTGDDHEIKRTGTFVKVSVNDQNISETKLEPGDRIRIGSVDFHYEVAPQE